MAEQQIPQEGEVDLGSLFKIIGKGFKNFFNAIGKFFTGFGHYFILMLIFLRYNAIKLGIAMTIGAGIGLYLDFTKPAKYSSSMVVEPNFKSTQQLYQNIDFYHELIKQRNLNFLAETFEISAKEAFNLRGFYIEPIKNENEINEFFDQFIKDVDTATVGKISVLEFKEEFTKYDYKYHEIKVKALSNTIFEKLSGPIINSIENNGYFKNQRKINDQNLVQNEKVLVKSLQQVDTLRKIYNEVLILEAKNSEMGTNINLADGEKQTNELELFDKGLELNEELMDNNREKVEKTEIINIVSTFNKVGVKERRIIKKKTVILGIGSGLLMLIFILFKQLNSYLRNYQ